MRLRSCASVLSSRALPALLGLLAFATGCAESSGVSKPAVVFPTRAEIAAIPAKSPSVEAFGTTDVAVTEWAFEAGAAAEEGAYEDASAWGGIARDLVAAHPRTAALSPALRCAAQEIARFYSQHQAFPAESLRRFAVARCGATAPFAMPVVWAGNVPAAVGDAEIAARARATMAKLAEPHLASGHRRHLLGVAAARTPGHAAVVLVMSDDEARIEPGRRVDAARRITLRGQVRGKYEAVYGLVNQGELGMAHCQTDPGVKLPAFAVTCALAKGDSSAWVQVLARKPDRYLVSPVADALVYEGDAAPASYTAHRFGAPMPVSTPAELSRAITGRLAAVRKAARLAPLAFADKQSAENARLAGTLFDAAIRDDDGVADRAALGLLAGWNVEGTIRSGGFLLGGVAPTRDAGAWVDFMLELPMGRATLLDPNARLLAVGPAIPEGAEALGAAITTYSLFESDDHAADEALFLRRLTEARQAHGLPAPIVVGGFDEMRAEKASVLREGKEPKAALDDMLSTVSFGTGAPSSGYVIETSDLETYAIPTELLTQGPMRVLVGITHHRARGAAWGQYVIFVISVGASSAMPVPTTEARASGHDGPGQRSAL
jgi:hypothetical protein